MKGSISHENFLRLRQMDNWLAIRSAMLKFQTGLEQAIIEHAEVAEAIDHHENPNAVRSMLGSISSTRTWSWSSYATATDHLEIKWALENTNDARLLKMIRKNNNVLNEQVLSEHFRLTVRDYVRSWKARIFSLSMSMMRFAC